MILELLSFLGLVFGVILYKYTKEEFRTGEKYFKIICRVILFLLVIFLIYYSNLDYLWIVILFVIGFFISFKFSNIYFYLGLMVSLMGKDLFNILTFLF